MKSRRGKAGDKIGTTSTAQLRTQIAFATAGDVIEHDDPVVVIPPVTKFSVPNLKRETEWCARFNLEAQRLNPKVMCHHRRGDEQQRKCGIPEFHGVWSLTEICCALEEQSGRVEAH